MKIWLDMLTIKTGNISNYTVQPRERTTALGRRYVNLKGMAFILNFELARIYANLMDLITYTFTWPI